MELINKPMIRIPTDPTNLSTDCIGISSTPRPKKIRGRGRPKGSKTKNKKPPISKKRSIDHNHNSQPRRKKRKPNRAHREAMPNATDDDIRKKLALERKAKNRKSAQESRERRKKQEKYLNDRLPKGLALKELLKSNKLIKNESSDIPIDYGNDSLSECLSRDAELREMKMILDEMCDNYASEYDQYPQVQRDKNSISDELIIEILKEYIGGNNNHTQEEIHLETDIDSIHLQVIGEIQNGVPMQIDAIPESATPNSFKATRGRKSKHNRNNNNNNNNRHRHVLKTPPTIPTIINHRNNDTELPPPVFGMDSCIDFSIAPESAVSSYPVPQDSVLNQYAIQSVYNQSNPQCIIKQEYDQLQQQQTPSTISTASTISIKQEEPIIKMTLIPTTIPSLPTQYPIPTQTMTVQPMIAQPMIAQPMIAQPIVQPLAVPLMNINMKTNHQMDSPTMYTTNPIAPCLHTPEHMHFIHPLPPQVPQTHSPIIHHSAQQDIKETKQMLIMDMDMDRERELDMNHMVDIIPGDMNGVINGNNGKNGKNFKNGNNLNNINNGEIMDIEMQAEMRILHQLVQIVQTFIIIICGMRMILDITKQKQQYSIKINKTMIELKQLIINYMSQKLIVIPVIIRLDIAENYIPMIIKQIKQHPLIPMELTMNVGSHYQIYRQIAMEILQNIKQQIIYYHKKINKKEQEKEVKIKKEMDLNLKKQQVNLESILSQQQCLEESVMNPMDYSIQHSKLEDLIKYKGNNTLQEKCFKILSSKIK